jgi:hypothetical protein
MDEAPDFFADGARVAYGQPGISLVLTRSNVGANAEDEVPPPVVVARVRMAPGMALQLGNLLIRAATDAQGQVQRAIETGESAFRLVEDQPAQIGSPGPEGQASDADAKGSSQRSGTQPSQLPEPSRTPH